jgi:hypothetical protein
VRTLAMVLVGLCAVSGCSGTAPQDAAPLAAAAGTFASVLDAAGGVVWESDTTRFAATADTSVIWVETAGLRAYLVDRVLYLPAGRTLIELDSGSAQALDTATGSAELVAVSLDDPVLDDDPILAALAANAGTLGSLAVLPATLALDGELATVVGRERGDSTVYTVDVDAQRLGWPANPGDGNDAGGAAGATVELVVRGGQIVEMGDGSATSLRVARFEPVIFEPGLVVGAGEFHSRKAVVERGGTPVPDLAFDAVHKIATQATALAMLKGRSPAPGDLEAVLAEIDLSGVAGIEMFETVGGASVHVGGDVAYLCTSPGQVRPSTRPCR